MIRSPTLVLTLVAVLVVAPLARAHCFDRKQDGEETDVDCGGGCGLCDHGSSCTSSRDCASGRCNGGACGERAYDGGPVPTGYQLRSSEHDAFTTVFTLGFVMFGVGYGVAYVGALSVPTDNAVLLVPVYGPWAMVARKNQDNPGFLVIDAVLQTAGLVLGVGGLVGTGKQLVREKEQPTVSLAPRAFASDAYGLDVYGRF